MRYSGHLLIECACRAPIFVLQNGPLKFGSALRSVSLHTDFDHRNGGRWYLHQRNTTYANDVPEFQWNFSTTEGYCRSCRRLVHIVTGAEYSPNHLFACFLNDDHNNPLSTLAFLTPCLIYKPMTKERELMLAKRQAAFEEMWTNLIRAREAGLITKQEEASVFGDVEATRQLLCSIHTSKLEKPRDI